MKIDKDIWMILCWTCFVIIMFMMAILAMGYVKYGTIDPQVESGEIQVEETVYFGGTCYIDNSHSRKLADASEGECVEGNKTVYWMEGYDSTVFLRDQHTELYDGLALMFCYKVATVAFGSFLIFGSAYWISSRSEDLGLVKKDE